MAEEFRDAKSDRADEDVFTREDFMDFIDSLNGKVKVGAVQLCLDEA